MLKVRGTSTWICVWGQTIKIVLLRSKVLLHKEHLNDWYFIVGKN